MDAIRRNQVVAVVLSAIGLILVCVAVCLTACEWDHRRCLTVGGAGGGALLLSVVLNNVTVQKIKGKGHR
jgi:hypothetical protein